MNSLLGKTNEKKENPRKDYFLYAMKTNCMIDLGLVVFDDLLCLSLKYRYWSMHIIFSEFKLVVIWLSEHLKL